MANSDIARSFFETFTRFMKRNAKARELKQYLLRFPVVDLVVLKPQEWFLQATGLSTSLPSTMAPVTLCTTRAFQQEPTMQCAP